MFDRLLPTLHTVPSSSTSFHCNDSYIQTLTIAETENEICTSSTPPPSPSVFAQGTPKENRLNNQYSRCSVTTKAVKSAQAVNNHGIHVENLIQIKPLAFKHNSTTPICCLKMALLNVRSLVSKTFLVNDLIHENKLDSIPLTETWLDATGSKELIETAPPDFTFTHCTKYNRKGGGVAIP